MFWTVGSDCHMLKVQEGKSTGMSSLFAFLIIFFQRFFTLLVLVEVLCAAFSENDQDILYCGTSDGSVQVWRQFRLLKSFSNLHSVSHNQWFNKVSLVPRFSRLKTEIWNAGTNVIHM